MTNQKLIINNHNTTIINNQIVYTFPTAIHFINNTIAYKESNCNFYDSSNYTKNLYLGCNLLSPNILLKQSDIFASIFLTIEPDKAAYFVPMSLINIKTSTIIFNLYDCNFEIYKIPDKSYFNFVFIIS